MAKAKDKSARHTMDVDQAAVYLNVSRDTVYRYASAGRLPGFKLGNRWRFRKTRLDEWMDEQCEKEKVARGK